MSNPLPSAEQYGAPTMGKPLTREGMSNPLPSAEQYGARTVGKAIDDRKNQQCAAIR